MSEQHPSRKPAALQRLAEHLALLNRRAGSISNMDNDMLSLIVSGTLNGENLAERYPDFYRNLLAYPDLREAFLDALETLEADRAGGLTPIPNPETRLDFLIRPPVAPKINIENKNQWSILWQKTIEQIQAIFSPPDLAYRAGQNLIEDPWFTLLREEMSVAGNTYSIALECTLAPEIENQLAAYLTLAVMPNTPSPIQPFPLSATLQWGDYQQKIIISAEGRERFPDIPLDSIFDPSLAQLQAGLNLTLETVV